MYTQFVPTGSNGMSIFITEPCFGPQVNFEEFKDGFVAVLSHSLDFSTSEDDSSYLEPGNLKFPRIVGASSVVQDHG